jgi:hypothetical protein
VISFAELVHGHGARCSVQSSTARDAHARRKGKQLIFLSIVTRLQSCESCSAHVDTYACTSVILLHSIFSGSAWHDNGHNALQCMNDCATLLQG